MSTKPHHLVKTLREFSKQYSGATRDLLNTAADELEKAHSDERVGRLICASRTFVKDWQDGDFQLPRLATIHAENIAEKVTDIDLAAKASDEAPGKSNYVANDY